MTGQPRLLDPSTRFQGLEGTTVLDFWQWMGSDLLSNALRGVLAEFLVAKALGAVTLPRLEWDAADVMYRGHPIEVKSAAYLQSWPQKKPSTIQFDVARKRSWHALTNTYDTEASRSADAYVFCLFAEQDHQCANVLDVRQWRFWVAATRELDRVLGGQKTVGLKRIEKLLAETTHAELPAMVDGALDTSDRQ
jgi:hypothetical protein